MYFYNWIYIIWICSAPAVRTWWRFPWMYLWRSSSRIVMNSGWQDEMLYPSTTHDPPRRAKEFLGDSFCDIPSNSCSVGNCGEDGERKRWVTCSWKRVSCCLFDRLPHWDLLLLVVLHFLLVILMGGVSLKQSKVLIIQLFWFVFDINNVFKYF